VGEMHQFSPYQSSNWESKNVTAQQVRLKKIPENTNPLLRKKALFGLVERARN